MSLMRSDVMFMRKKVIDRFCQRERLPGRMMRDVFPVVYHPRLVVFFDLLLCALCGSVFILIPPTDYFIIYDG